MSEPIINKRCSKCKSTKPVSEFDKHSLSKDGYQYWCKECKKQYALNYSKTEKYKKGQERYYQSEKCKQTLRSYNRSKKGKQVHRRWRQSNKGKQSLRKYRQSKNGEIAYRKSKRTYLIAHFDRCQARFAVGNAVQSGKLRKPTEYTCSKCPDRAQEYHHDSYAPDHWLDVIPVCRSCHINIHHHTVEAFSPP